MPKSEIYISWLNGPDLFVLHSKQIKHKRWLLILGLGVSYWPLALNFVPKEEFWTEKLRLMIQTDMNYLFENIPRVRRLRIMTAESLEYSKLATLVQLRKLVIQGPVMDKPDLSHLKKLRYLAGRYRSIENMQGLSDLKELRYLEIPYPKQKFLDSLPSSLKSLFLESKLPPKLNLGHLGNLEILTLHMIKNLDFSSMCMTSPSVKTLRIYSSSNLTNQHLVTQIFPGLKEIVCRMSKEDLVLLRSSVDPQVKIRTPLFWSF